MANNAAIEQQYRHFEAELANELGVGIDIDHGDRRKGLGAFELGQLVQHLVTEATTLAGDYDETLVHETPGQVTLAVTFFAVPGPSLRWQP